MIHNFTREDNFVRKLEHCVKTFWDAPALEDYRGETQTYGQFASELEKNVLLWRAAGLRKGDKVALNARSSASWARIFFSTQVGEFVSVQIFNGFMPADTAGLVNHAEVRILYTEKATFCRMNFESMPLLIAAIDANTGCLLASRGNFAELYGRRSEIFSEAHPGGYTAADVHYPEVPFDALAAIMYTSGSTGNPKGVMLTNLNFSANIYMIVNHFPYRSGECYVSVLPYCHIFGMVYDMMEPLCSGMHLVVLGIPPVPSNLLPALKKFRPRIFFSVPLILTKLMEHTLGKEISSREGAAKLAAYKDNPEYCRSLADKFLEAMGGGIEVFVTGGAAIPENLERLFVEKLRLPFITGYGMTETAPTISLGEVGDYRLRECGKWLHEILDLKIDSPDPAAVPGEILVKGPVLFAGYYKNDDATRAVMTSDGWFRTGDVATVDSRRSLFIVGRCKNMILNSSGQNIFPEEIQVVLDSLPYVAESLVIEKEGKPFAIIVPNGDAAALSDLTDADLHEIMVRNIQLLNDRIPAYSAVAGFRLQKEPFAKTPKGSIRRYLYTE